MQLLTFQRGFVNKITILVIGTLFAIQTYGADYDIDSIVVWEKGERIATFF